MSTDALLAAALELPEAQRWEFVDRLLEALGPDDVGLSLDDPNLLLELERRFSDLEGAVSWEQLRDEA
jgi:hypothetical protein